MSDRLPNAERAHVESRKVTDYLLSPEHSLGKGKAKFFSQFGFNRDEHEDFVTSLKKHAVSQPVVEVKESPHGVKYVLECSCQSPDRRNPCIRSVWIIEPGEERPRLITAFPN